MWPYRPNRLSELLDAREIDFLLGQGVLDALGSDVAVIELDDDGQPRALAQFARPATDAASTSSAGAPAAAGTAVRRHESPFCHFLRYGRVGGRLAFEGADEECTRCEARFGARAIERFHAGPQPAGSASAQRSGGAVESARCHIGLLDFAAPVRVRGRALAAVIAGRRVESDDDRTRIAKRVGKLGKLTRGEVRSIEEAGERAAPAIVPRDDRARELLLAEIPRIPRADAQLGETLEELASLLGTLSQGRYALARRSWEDAVIDDVVTEGVELPQRRAHVLRWVDGAVGRLERHLGCAHVAFFARLPEDLGKSEQPLRLLAQSGLPADERVKLRDDAPVLDLDPKSAIEPARSLEECVARGLDGASSLISALHPGPSCPIEWKDRLTRSVFVAGCKEAPGLEVVVAFGPPARERAGAEGRPALVTPEPEREDFGLLWRAARRVAERYLLGACESVRRSQSITLARFEEAERAKQPSGPIRPQRFDLRKLLDRAIESVAERAGSRRVSFDSQALPERVMVEADRTQIRRVVDGLFAYVVEIAMPDAGGTRPSVRLTMRRDRRMPRRWSIAVDVVGKFLTHDERRRLFAGGARRAADPTGDAAADGERERRDEPFTFRDAQQSLSWHRGRLQVESERVEALATPDAATPSWTGRTVFTIELPERPPRGGHRPASGDDTAAGDAAAGDAAAGDAARHEERDERARRRRRAPRRRPASERRTRESRPPSPAATAVGDPNVPARRASPDAPNAPSDAPSSAPASAPPDGQ